MSVPHLLLLVAALIVCTVSPAQSSREKKAYERTVEKATIKSYTDFLKKYPESVFSEEISSRLDTALNVSPLSGSSATALLRAIMKGRGAAFSSLKAAGVRRNGKDYIVGVLPETGYGDSITFHIAIRENGVWQMPFKYNIRRCTLLPEVRHTYLDRGPEVVTVGGQRYLSLSFTNISGKDDSREYVETLISTRDGSTANAAFIGIGRKGNKIEGQYQSTDGSADSLISAYLAGRIGANERLATISSEDASSDLTMESWKEENPDAMTDASTVHFITLPEECSVLEHYNRIRSRERAGLYEAAMFNFRGNTVVCASSDGGKAMLVWCEAECRDRTVDRCLNTIYFERDAVLGMFFYHGNRVFKYRIDLNTGALLR